MRKIIVGQQPGVYNDSLKRKTEFLEDGRIRITNPVIPEPLWAGIPNSTGRRLAMLSNLEVADYHRTFIRCNILPVHSGRTFSVSKYTKDMGRYLRKNIVQPGDLVVALGYDVMNSLCIKVDGMFEMFEAEDGAFYSVIPHPSSHNRWYDDPENRAVASEFMTSLAYHPNEYSPVLDDDEPS